MPLAPGARLGPYEIVSLLGAGGMGEVYKARDTRLDRTVAIKVLPDHLGSDPDLRQRFEREARAVAALSHPNICAIFDVGHEPGRSTGAAQGVDYLVMEHLDGETLAARLERGSRSSGWRSDATSVSSPSGHARGDEAASTGAPARGLPVDETIRIATQLATALAAAHRAGIVHRDLKPGNIMLTKAGVKVLDFGLARLVGDPTATAAATLTITTPLTSMGTLLGTVPYMSPEQVEGKAVDARSDIFALGAVTYEMATGRRAFDGGSQASLIAAILERQPPPINQVQPLAPAGLERIVRTCLAKDPEDRWQDAGDIARQLTWVAAEIDPDRPSRISQVQPDASSPDARVTRFIGWRSMLIALAAIGLAGYLGTLALNRGTAVTTQQPAGTLGAIHFAADVPGVTFASARVSPDGRALALVGNDPDGGRGVWIKQFDQPGAERIPKLDNVTANLAWSADGRELAVATTRGLAGVRLDGWLARSLTTQAGFVPFTWGASGTILEGTETRLRALAAATGDITVVQSRFSRDPMFLPDGRRFLYIGRKDGAEGNPDGVYLASLDAPDTRRLVLPTISSVAVDAGHLLFVRDGTLLAQPFDLDRGELTGQPSPIVDGVMYFRPNGRAMFHAAGGTVAYLTREPDDSPVWFDRAGVAGEPLGAPGLHSWVGISPDGRRAVVSRLDRRTGTGDLYLLDLARGTTTRLTNDEFSEGDIVWSPDGRSIAYGWDGDGPPDVYVLDVDSGKPARLVYRTSAVEYPTTWLPGNRLLVRVYGSGLRVVRLDGTVDTSVMHLPSGAPYCAISPDGRWLAVQTADTGRPEIYVQPFGRPGAPTRVSINGGTFAIWARDGRSLYFRQGRSIFEARVQPGEQFVSDAPRLLLSVDRDIARYDVTPDGKRFLITRRPPPDFLPVQVIVNWTQKLQ